MLNKTIASLVTAPITQNIALIRISGSKSYEIITKIFDRSLPSYPQTNSQLVFGHIINPLSKKEIVDQVLLLCFYSPNSFTGEDVIEISCHGNLYLVEKILTLILEQGAELAQPGEFTKQAFFNGKLNLVQANSINDLIRAPSLSATKLALQNLNEESQKKLSELEEKFLQIIGIMEVNIDYPEYDEVECLTGKKVLESLQDLKNELVKISSLGQQSRNYQEGIKVAIIGKPNVGKSTLLNALLKEEKVIVSSIAGTTRDIVEAKYSLKDIPLLLYDTAGIHETQEEIEKIGVAKSKQILKKVDLVFFLLDNSRPWEKEDENIYQLIKQSKYLVIVNKSDLPSKLILPREIKKTNPLQISAEKKKLQSLEKKILELFAGDLGMNISLYPLLSHSWQQSRLKRIINKLNEVEKSLKEEIPVDAVIIDLQEAFHLLRELSGKDYQEDLLDLIFSRFCLGK